MSARTRRAAHAALAVVLTGAVALTSSPAPAAQSPEPRARAGAATDEGGTLGRWRVQPAGTGTWEVTWRSPSRLPVTRYLPSGENATPVTASG